MFDMIFIGDRRDAALFRAAGVPAYAPARSHLVERVLAERWRCRVLAMRRHTLTALPAELARALREGTAPSLTILPEADRHENTTVMAQELLARVRRMPARVV